MSATKHWIKASCLGLVALGGVAYGQSALDEPIASLEGMPSLATMSSSPDGSEGFGLNIERPRLTMRMPAVGHGVSLFQPERRILDSQSAFSWSLEAWQLNTASLAHIQCSQHSMTIDSFVAEDCRFVDQPVPDHAVNLVQLRGEWMPAPGLSVGVGAFHGARQSTAAPWSTANSLMYLSNVDGLDAFTPARQVDGLDLSVSFGLNTDRVGDFLMGLQLARYRQRHSMTDFGFPQDPFRGLEQSLDYANSAQLLLGWRRGNFGGEVTGQYRELPTWLGQPGSATLNSFDLEFSWRPRNSALSIGISNVLDASPRAEEPMEQNREDPHEGIFGRIPYVRYKHDL